MKFANFYILLIALVIISCSKTENNSLEFIEQTTGRYLYNSDEVVEVYFKENDLLMKWRGANNIIPLKLKDNTFFVKEMNEKIQFLMNPTNDILYLSLIPKGESKTITYNFKKLNSDEKIPSDYLKINQFDKALAGYLNIQKIDSLDGSINESNFNSLGYSKLRKDDFKTALDIFKINVALYPNSSNVYDSLADAYKKSGDTIQAISNYKKSLALDSGNKRAKRNIDRLEKKN
ncbi:MAG: hypothetical protein GQ552_05710 [Flavobacteriaceae bacterium]|nr:hypothetical protein [Flavobacteriaceae bacterium]